MKEGRVRKKKIKKGVSMKKVFLTTLISLLVVFVTGATVLVLVYGNIYETGNPLAKTLDIFNSDKNSGVGGVIDDLFDKVPDRTTFVILGLDDESPFVKRADLIMLGCYNSVTKTLDIISIPRDTRTEVSAEVYSNFLYKPRSRTVRFGEIFNFSGNVNGTHLTGKHIQDQFGIQLDYYITVELDAFRDFIDDIGGVEFNVPQRMYYTDPFQNLYIDLHPGLQTLNGAQAEGLLRYRKADVWNPQSPGYPMGDIKRVQVQQEFMKVVIKEALSDLGNIVTLGNTAVKYVKTNFPIAAAPKYALNLSGFEAENINTYTLPGTATDYSPYFYLPNNAEINKLIFEIFHKPIE
jgi:LCP family protein required for cell wall assembly